MLSPNTMLQIAYVANHGIDLFSVTDINQNNPVYDQGVISSIASGTYPPVADHITGRPLYTSCPQAQALGGPCFPYLGYFNYLSNQSNSIYQSLQVTLTRKYSKGLYLLAGYTYAHAIDTATSNLAGVPQNSLNYAAERGNGDYDIRPRLTLSASYDVPSWKAPLQLGKNWQLTSILNFQTGMPYSLYDSSDDISYTGEGAD